MSMQEIAPAREYVPKPESFWTTEKVVRPSPAHCRWKTREGAPADARMLNASPLRQDQNSRHFDARAASAPPGRRQRNGFWSFTVDPASACAPGMKDLASEPSDAAMSLADLDNTRCHWPISGAGLDMMFCGERSNEGGPYCGRHHSIAYRGKRQG